MTSDDVLARIAELEAALGRIAFGAGSRHDKEIAFEALGQEARDRFLGMRPAALDAGAPAEGQGYNPSLGICRVCGGQHDTTEPHVPIPDTPPPGAREAA